MSRPGGGLQVGQHPGLAFLLGHLEQGRRESGCQWLCLSLAVTIEPTAPLTVSPLSPGPFSPSQRSIAPAEWWREGLHSKQQAWLATESRAVCPFVLLASPPPFPVKLWSGRRDNTVLRQRQGLSPSPPPDPLRLQVGRL